jgi:hypothetical protein
MRTHRIAVIAGDGIGREVTPAAITVAEQVARKAGFALHLEHFPWGCDYYLEHRRMMPPDGLDQLRRFDAIYLGAIGDPGRARPRVGVGADPAHPPALRAVRQPAADAAAAGHHLAARRTRRLRHRHGVRARELRGRVRGLGGRCTSARRTRWPSRPASSRGTASRGGALRLRAGAPRPRKLLASADQVQRAEALDGAVGRGRRPGPSRDYPDVTLQPSTTSTRSPRG